MEKVTLILLFDLALLAALLFIMFIDNKMKKSLWQIEKDLEDMKKLLL